MYESFFELDQRPFTATPLVTRYFAAETIESARKSLARCIERAEGAGLVVGPVGTGKTLLCYLLAEQFKSTYSVVLLFSGNLSTRRELLQAILFELGLPYRGMEEGELRLALIDHLTRGEQCPSGMLLIVDEAHALPLKLLEEVRMITNLVRKGEPRVRLVLAGNPVLEEHLASPKLAALSQRLAARCYLESFDWTETHDYIRAQIAEVGGDAARIFRPEALDAIYRATDGIPRLVNQLCDQALLLAASLHRRPIDVQIVETAWANQQQLPTPWSAGDATADESESPHDVIEFGQLDEPQLDDPQPGEMVATQNDAVSNASTLPLLHLAQFDDLAEAGDAVLGLPPSVPEVELVFDDDEVETYPVETYPALLDAPAHLPVTATTQTPANQVGAKHAYTLHDELHDEPDFEQFLAAAEPGLEGGDNVFPDDAVEEVVVDRYATLDAQKGKPAVSFRGSRPPQAKDPVARAAARLAQSAQGKPLHAAEKTLTLAEALVRQATAAEETRLPQQASSAGNFSVLATPETTLELGCGPWVSLDLLAPGVSDGLVPTPPSPPVPVATPQPVAVMPAAVIGPATLASPVDAKPKSPALVGQVSPCPSTEMEPFQIELRSSLAVPNEPELIIVEDDVQASTVEPPPQVEPVSRKSYRQLFARLRKG